MARNARVGSTLEGFLDEQGIQQEVTALAMKRVVAWQIAHAMREAGLTKVAMAARMRTSRSLLDRLLDAEDAGLPRKHRVAGIDALRVAQFGVDGRAGVEPDRPGLLVGGDRRVHLRRDA